MISRDAVAVRSQIYMAANVLKPIGQVERVCVDAALGEVVAKLDANTRRVL